MKSHWKLMYRVNCTELFSDSEVLQTPKLVTICTDFRFLDFSYIPNLFLKRLMAIGDFYLFTHRWNFSKTKHHLDSDTQLMAFITKAVALLHEYPDIYPHTSLYIWNKGFSVSLPNRHFLKQNNGDELVERLQVLCP